MKTASFFSRIKSAAKAALQAFRRPKTTVPTQPTPPRARPPKPARVEGERPAKTKPSKRPQVVRNENDFKPSANKSERVTRLQEMTLNKNREAASTFYAATVGLWNVPEGTTEDQRNRLIIDKLGVSDLKEAFDLVMSRFNELANAADDDSVSPPPALTQLQTELSARISGNETT